MAASIQATLGKYEPLPRFAHTSVSLGSKAIVQGGVTNDSSEKHGPVVEIFVPHSGLWQRTQADGDGPLPGTYLAAGASLHDDLFTFGGKDGRNFFNAVHRLDSKTWRWSEISPQNADGAPTPKDGCGMIAFRNCLGVFGGYGIPQGPSDPLLFIKNTKHLDGRGWTNEFHIYTLPEGVWSCPATSGDRPPPCDAFTFTAVDDRRAVVFGGYSGEHHRLMNDVYILDLSTLKWKKMISGERPWPEVRAFHAACCLNYGQQFPQLLVTGGLGKDRKPLGDIWTLDIERGKWRKESATMKGRWGHSLAAFSLGPGLVEVVEFGGSPGPWTGSYEKQPKIANTTLLQFRLMESTGRSQWKLNSVADSKQHRSQQRMAYFTATPRAGVDNRQVERKTRPRESEDQAGIAFTERDRPEQIIKELKIQRDLLLVEKEATEERVRVLEEERDRAMMEARAAEQEILIQKQRVMEAEAQTVQESRRLLTEMKELQNKVRILEQERDSSRVKAREAEKEKEMMRQGKGEAEAQAVTLREEKRKAEERAKTLETERDKMKVEVEREKGKLEQVKCQNEEKVNDLKHERDKAVEEKKNADFERDKEKKRRQMIEGRLKELEGEGDIEQNIVESKKHAELKVELQTKSANIKTPDVGIQQLEQSMEQGTGAVVKATSSEMNVKKIRLDDREVEERTVEEEMASETQEKKEEKKIVREANGEEREGERGEGEEREGVRGVERGEREGMRGVEGKIEAKGEAVMVELQPSPVIADQPQQSLDEVEGREHEKSLVQQEDISELENIIAHKTVKVTNEEQLIDWEDYGLRIHIPHNSLPDDCSELELEMAVSRPGDCKLPTEDGILVSAVYSFSHDLGDRKLRHPATVEMQHWVASSSCSSLCIVQSDDITPPYQFHIIPGGEFDKGSDYGSVELDHFCSFCVYLQWFLSSLIWNLKPCAALYYTKITHRSFHFNLYLAPYLNAVLKEIDRDIKEKDNKCEIGATSLFKFHEGEHESTIELDLPSQPQSGWTLKSISHNKIEIADVVNMRSFLIPFEVRVRWAGREGESVSPLEYDTVLTGATDHHLTVVSPDICVSSELSSDTNRITAKDFASFPEPELANLMEIVGVDVQTKWRAIGLGLGLNKRQLDIIQQSHQGSVNSVQDCMTDVFHQWCEGNTSEYSWKKLAEVLCSRAVNMPNILPDIHAKLNT